MNNVAIIKESEFGKYAYESSTGKIFWADNKVWENLPHLVASGFVTYLSPDGYLLEPYDSELARVTKQNSPLNKKIGISLNEEI